MKKTNSKAKSKTNAKTNAAANTAANAKTKKSTKAKATAKTKSDTKAATNSKTKAHPVASVILWLFSLFILMLALAGFSVNILSGMLFLAAAVMVNPIFLKFLRGRGLRFKKILYIPAVFLIWLCGIFTFPTSESSGSANPQEARSDADTVEVPNADSVALTGTPADADDVIEDVGSDALPENGSDTLSELSVHFIDVGQGDATLIQCDGHAMLIDAGDNSKGTAVQLYLTKQGIEKLDYLVLTHPDADHIGGADVIITKFDIDHIFMSDYTQDTKTYEDVLDALQYKNENWFTPSVGDTYSLGDADFTILAPLNTYDNANDSSVALMLTHGEKKFLFTGDCSENAEKDMAADGQNLSADVYLVGHHGSRYSSSQTFMDAVSPTYAVISCGEYNSYGHPGAEVLNRFRAMGIQVFRTDEQGSIVATSDGSDITWNCAPSDTWKAGEPTISSSASTQDVKTDTAKTDNTDNAPKQETVSDSKAAASTSQDTTATDNTSASNMQSAASDDNAVSPDTQNPTPSDDISASSDTTVSGGSGSAQFATGSSPGAGLYIGNKNNHKLHRSSCHKLPLEKNQAVFNTREEAVAAGYNDPCKLCNP